ncbi:MAG TPA: hypothetical protein VN025_07790 [Candidatus Dormibacteraeota bacterium]|jgi:hypothetical protein|nr:hypothetical protein [Candidatus Dormibacteraeota bacterium]
MFALSHLFYPWGFIVQIVALIHFVRRRPDNYWFYIILFGGFIGSSAYLVVEAIPDLGLLRGVFQGFGRRTRIEKLEMDIVDNPSAGNFEELGEMYLDEKKFEKSREAFDKAIAARSDSPHTFYFRAKASLGLSDFAAAIPDLEVAVNSDPKLDFYRASALLANAYAQTGDYTRAEAMFAEPVRLSNTPETLYNYAKFLQLAGRKEEAKQAAQALMMKKRTLPRYMQRYERLWFRKGKTLIRELKQLEEKKSA